MADIIGAILHEIAEVILRGIGYIAFKNRVRKRNWPAIAMLTVIAGTFLAMIAVIARRGS